jgi:arginine exporter protein ArgO
MTMLSFAAIFAGLGVASTPGNYVLAMVLVLGVFIGSALWWLLLCAGISLFQTKLTPRRLQWVNRISGVMITMFGLVALLSLRS